MSIGPLVAAFAGSRLGGFIGGLPPIDRAITQISNATFANEIPPPGELLDLWRHNYINYGQMSSNLRMHGIDVTGTVSGSISQNLAVAWKAVVSNARIKPADDLIASAFYHNRIDKADEEWVFANYKHSKDHYEKLHDIYRSYLTPGECIALYNRQIFTASQFDHFLGKFGGYTDEVKGYYSELASSIPGPSDIVRFAVREAFNFGQVMALELDAEINEQEDARKWLQRQGLGVSIEYTDGIPSGAMDWFNAYWYAHWQLPSPTQLYEFRHKFRPDRVHRYNRIAPGLRPFGESDMNAYLKANDYTPQVRQWLAANSLRTPRIVDIRNMYYANIITREDFVAFQLDMGYTDIDAEDVAKLADIEKPRWLYKRRTTLLDKWDTAWVNQIIEAFRVGSTSESQFTGDLTWAIGDKDAANSQVQSEIIRKNNLIVKEWTNMVKSGYFTGELTADNARLLLLEGGIDSKHADNLVSLWQARMTLPRRVISVRKLVEWYVTGLIGENDLVERMQRLGYSGQNTALTLAEAERKRQLAIIKAEEEAIKKSQAAERAARTKARQSRSDMMTAIEDANRFRTPTKISQWYREGKIGYDDASEVLKALLTPEEDLDRWLGGN